MQKTLSVGLTSAFFAVSLVARAETNSSRVYNIAPDVAAKAVASQVLTQECNISFPMGRTEGSDSLVSQCVKGLQGHDVKFISITAAASPGGKLRSNQILSQRRAEHIRMEMARLYPQAKIVAHGIGVQPTMGRSAHVVVVTAPTAEMASADFSKLSHEVVVPPTVVQVPVVQNPEPTDLNKVNLDSTTKFGNDKLDRENWMRLALRGANDKYYDDDKYYGSAGLELAYVRSKTFIPSARGELGATASAMLNNDYKNSFRGYNAHAFVGPGFAYNGFVIGARALGGGVWEEDRKFRADGGGEGRLGYESPNGLSIFAAAGRTNKLARYGVDLGMIF